MKKGIYVFGLLVFLVIYCNQDVLAATQVNGVTLTISPTTSATANKIYYQGSTSKQTVTLPWKEKAVYSATEECKITVSTKVKGDLIVKVDFVSATTGGALSVSSSWLKYKTPTSYDPGIIGFFAHTGVPASGVPVDKRSLKTLCLETDLTAKTITLFTQSLNSYYSLTYYIFTAILVDDADAPHPQVLGVDIQSVFFNYIDTNTTTNPYWYDETPIWLTFIQAATQ